MLFCERSARKSPQFMNSETALIFYYTKENRNSYNALAGAIEKYLDLRKINVYFFPNEKSLFQEIPAILQNHKKVIIGISFFTPQFWQTKDIVEKLKKRKSPKVILPAGGPHPSGDPHTTLRIGIDLVINGEGKETFLELLHKIINEEDHLKIKGLSFFAISRRNIFFLAQKP